MRCTFNVDGGETRDGFICSNDHWATLSSPGYELTLNGVRLSFYVDRLTMTGYEHKESPQCRMRCVNVFHIQPS